MALFGSKRDSTGGSASDISSFDSNLTLVRNRLKPHFLNNVLSSIYYLCDSDPSMAQDVSTTFSAYLMNVVEALNSNELIPFTKELDLIRHYMAIEHLRLEDRLRIDYDVYISDFKVPPLSIETLVEVAVKRNIAAKDGGGTLTVATRRIADEGVQIKIMDDGIGFDPSDPPFGSEDLNNVKNVLMKELNAEMSIESSPGSNTEINITFHPEK